MMKSLLQLAKKYRELIAYGIFGVGATLINILAYYLFADVLGVQYMVSNAIAWVLAFLFAFVTNKLFVFESKSWSGATAAKEMWGFFLARAGTGVLDMAMMWLLAGVLHVNEMFAKVFVNILVIIINYVASKFWIFRRKT